MMKTTCYDFVVKAKANARQENLPGGGIPCIVCSVAEGSGNESDHRKWTRRHSQPKERESGGEEERERQCLQMGKLPFFSSSRSVVSSVSFDRRI